MGPVAIEFFNLILSSMYICIHNIQYSNTVSPPEIRTSFCKTFNHRLFGSLQKYNLVFLCLKKLWKFPQLGWKGHTGSMLYFYSQKWCWWGGWVRKNVEIAFLHPSHMIVHCSCANVFVIHLASMTSVC